MTKPRKPKLKPCPFCGRAVTLEGGESALTGSKLFRIVCNRSTCPDPFWHLEEDRKTLIRRWNRRAKL